MSKQNKTSVSEADRPADKAQGDKTLETSAASARCSMDKPNGSYSVLVAVMVGWPERRRQSQYDHFRATASMLALHLKNDEYSSDDFKRLADLDEKLDGTDTVESDLRVQPYELDPSFELLICDMFERNFDLLMNWWKNGIVGDIDEIEELPMMEDLRSFLSYKCFILTQRVQENLEIRRNLDSIASPTNPLPLDLQMIITEKHERDRAARYVSHERLNMLAGFIAMVNAIRSEDWDVLPPTKPGQTFPTWSELLSHRLEPGSENVGILCVSRNAREHSWRAQNPRMYGI